MQIRFVYTIQPSSTFVLQAHNRELLVEVAGDGDPEWGNPNHQQLAEAERLFMQSIWDRYPYGCLIKFVSGPADGSVGRFSEYRSLLPAKA